MLKFNTYIFNPIKTLISSVVHGFYTMSAAFTVGLIANSGSANAAGNDFGDIAENIIESLESLPGLISGLAYLGGLGFGVLGILKIKDHVDNPQQTQLKDGAVRLAAGGSLFALPIIYEASLNTIGTTTSLVEAAELNRVDYAVSP